MTPPAGYGRFITLEGGEGAGKSTQARLLAEALAASGLPVLQTREPGGAPGAELLRGLLLGSIPAEGPIAWSPRAEMLLHFAARAEHVETTIRPALAAGMWVVCDRFADSTMVYQGYGQGADRADIATLTAMMGLRPDLTLVLDVDVPTSLARLRGRGGASDRYESLGAPFFELLRAGFLAVAEAEPARCVVIAAEAGPAQVQAAIWRAVTERLGLP